MTASLPPVVADYLAAVNAFNLDGMVAAFAPDAPTSTTPAARSAASTPSAAGPRRWSETTSRWNRSRSSTTTAKPSCGPATTARTTRPAPAELIMSDYFTVRDGKIVSLKVIRNQPSPYWPAPPPATRSPEDTPWPGHALADRIRAIVAI